MRVSVAHRLGAGEARERLEAGLVSMLNRFGDSVSDVSREWEGDTATFSFRAQGFEVSGQMMLSEEMVTMDLKLPLAARLFEGRIRAEVGGELDKILNASETRRG